MIKLRMGHLRLGAAPRRLRLGGGTARIGIAGRRGRAGGRVGLRLQLRARRRQLSLQRGAALARLRGRCALRLARAQALQRLLCTGFRALGFRELDDGLGFRGRSRA